MKINFPILLLIVLCIGCQTSQIITDSSATNKNKNQSLTEISNQQLGFFDFYHEQKKGKILLSIKQLDQEFLYVNSLAAGVGSNDIGLDRGQLGNNRVVRFTRSGPKVLLIQTNYDYRAESDNPAEQKSVQEAFAESVLWGFDMVSESDTDLQIDLTPFLFQDAHGVADALDRSGEGNYRVDPSRSALYQPRIKNFPDNSEFEVTLTFTGKPTGKHLPQVVPTPSAVSVRQHHSFIRLPDDGYKKRVMDPRSGFFGIQYQDYATPIAKPLVKRFINRHRLEKKDKNAAVSEAVNPIIYYLDPGAPEPVRSALLDGARWWNKAFEAAGFKNAFQVRILPEDADPLDVRFNVIQWVHRATRGWSYGGSVIDPRTGEIIKGHVSLGSLRVRQDYLIAQGLLGTADLSGNKNPRLELSLARLRQLSAHEVGHTLGLAHNFAASTYGRASVMDYPHPYVFINDKNEIDFSQAYDDEIGDWDKLVIRYGYSEFSEDVNEKEALNKIVEEGIKKGFKYISDRDARPFGGANSVGHLWDNGADPVTELKRIMNIRKIALNKLGAQSIAKDSPLSSLEEVLVPMYLLHRYQVEAVAKLIGGVNYTYAVRDDGQEPWSRIPGEMQRAALRALLQTIRPETLSMPQKLIELIPPKPPGYYRNRENFKSNMGLIFDPLAAAESATATSIQLLLHPQRAARLIYQHNQDKTLPGLEEVIDQLIQQTWKASTTTESTQNIQLVTAQLVLKYLFVLAHDESASVLVRGIAINKINELEKWMQSESADATYVVNALSLMLIKQFRDHPADLVLPQTPKMPDGSPIGMEWRCGHR